MAAGPHRRRHRLLHPRREADQVGLRTDQTSRRAERSARWQSVPRNGQTKDQVNNLPPGVTQDMIDRAAGFYPDPEEQADIEAEKADMALDREIDREE